jgi:GAF domain-containing protein
MSETDETDRLTDLASYGIMDTPPEPQFDAIVALARALFDTPISTITLVDHERQWFKARAGIDNSQGAREDSFCSHAMQNEGVFVVEDAREDARFAHNPLVIGAPNIRFYAGAPLRSPAGHSLGAVCIISPEPRGAFSATDRKKLELLATIVGNEMELKKQTQQAQKLLHDKDSAAREAQCRIKNSLDYANLLAEVRSDDISTEQLAAFAMAAWKQYSEAGGVLMSSIKSLRERMKPADYQALLESMPGFAM